MTIVVTSMYSLHCKNRKEYANMNVYNFVIILSLMRRERFAVNIEFRPRVKLISCW